jgi:hypothetical protein
VVHLKDNNGSAWVTFVFSTITSTGGGGGGNRTNAGLVGLTGGSGGGGSASAGSWHCGNRHSQSRFCRWYKVSGRLVVLAVAAVVQVRWW